MLLGALHRAKFGPRPNSTRWRKALEKWVEHRHAAIQVCGDYKEIEADEVVIRKEIAPQQGAMV